VPASSFVLNLKAGDTPKKKAMKTEIILNVEELEHRIKRLVMSLL